MLKVCLHLYARRCRCVHDPREWPCALWPYYPRVLVWVGWYPRARVRPYRAPHLISIIFDTFVSTGSEWELTTSMLVYDNSQLAPIQTSTRKGPFAQHQSNTKGVRIVLAVSANAPRRKCSESPRLLSVARNRRFGRRCRQSLQSTPPQYRQRRLLYSVGFHKWHQRAREAIALLQSDALVPK